MAYCTPDDMITLFGVKEMTQLSNLDTAGAKFPNEERIISAIAFADSTIDGFLSTQILLPLPEPTGDPATDNYDTLRQILKGKSIDIARYILESRGEPRPDVKIRYEMALDWLKMVSKGEIELKQSDTANTDGSTDGSILFGGEKRVFTRKSLRGYTDTWLRG